MASKKSTPTAAPQKASETITSVHFLEKSLQEIGDLSEINRRLSHKNSWVVFTSGDSLSHYGALIGNLTGHISNASEPAFQLMRSTIKAGLPKTAFDRIKSAIATTTEQLASITEISKRTVARRQKFKPDESERLLRVASAFQKALELFEDLDKARQWFATPKSALGGLTPIECCDTETGSDEVENLLGRIDESVYS